MMFLPFLVGALPVLIYLFWKASQMGKRDPRLPPGPPTIPFLGNAHMIPTTGLGRKFREWSQEYGPIFSLKVLNSTMIVISDRKAVHSLLDRKGSIYSDRPRVAGASYVTGDHFTPLQPHGPEWKSRRMVVIRYLSAKMVDTRHNRLHEAEATRFISNVVKSPDSILDYAKMFSSSVITSLVWGHRAADPDSFWCKDFYHEMEEFNGILEPGAQPPVEEIPLLWYLPGQWKTKLKESKRLRKEMWSKARSIVDKRREAGDKRECLVDQKLDEFQAKGWPMPEWVWNEFMGKTIEGGAETTSNQLLTLVLALAAYPAVQEKARKEIDAACGADRMPSFLQDFKSCPYINCIVKEGMRWRPTARTGLPHKLIQDDEYNGYLIPKNSIVFLSVWSIHQNESIYKDAETFNPDRYLHHPKLACEYANSVNYENRDHYGFGGGRRLCPGIHLADRSMWRIAAKLIWSFEISAPAGLDVNAYTEGVLVMPLPFKVEVKVRSDKHLATIRREFAQAEEFLSQYD